MKKILVPTDFSDCARAAENIGLEIAQKAGAEIHFLNLIMTPLEWVKLPKEREKNFPEVLATIGNAKAELGELKRRAKKMGLDCQTHINFDQGREEIYDHIKHHHHDFVVMGSHGTKGVRELLGSNTQKVVRYAEIPVLVVKENTSFSDLNKILFASDFTDHAIKPFGKVSEFARFMQAEIMALYINVPGRFLETDEIDERMAKFISNFNEVICTTHHYDALSIERGIIKFSERVDSEIIAIATHGDRAIFNLFSSSITEQLVNHSESPVLCLNIQ